MSCLYPGCKKLEVTRGLCLGHYNMARKLVARGKVRWEELEAGGKCLKAKRPKPREAVKAAWFLDGEKEPGASRSEDGIRSLEVRELKFEPVVEEEPMERAPEE